MNEKFYKGLIIITKPYMYISFDYSKVILLAVWLI